MENKNIVGSLADIAEIIINSGFPDFRITLDKRYYIVAPKWYQFWQKPKIAYTTAGSILIEIFTDKWQFAIAEQLDAIRDRLPITVSATIITCPRNIAGLYLNGKPALEVQV